MLESAYIVNTPMFFDGIWESEIKPHLSPKTISKICSRASLDLMIIQISFLNNQIMRIWTIHITRNP